jgi:hypothetical protein
MCEAHRRQFLARTLMLGAVGAFGAVGGAWAQSSEPGVKWICPPCGCAADGKEFDAAGDCPACNMPLIHKPTAPPTTAPAPASKPSSQAIPPATGPVRAP